jgi:hypothetical protein
MGSADDSRFHPAVGAVRPFSTSLQKNIFTGNRQPVSISHAQNRRMNGGEK